VRWNLKEAEGKALARRTGVAYEAAAGGNLMRAYEGVIRNKGAPGVDGMTAGELKAYLKAYWPEIREQLREGRYQPRPVRKVEIPKPGGG
jgi:hypothetical protein